MCLTSLHIKHKQCCVRLWLLIALAAFLAWDMQQMDVCNAFLDAILTEPVYMQCVQGYERPGYMILLRRALYGLKQSPRAFYDTLAAYYKLGLLKLSPGLLAAIRTHFNMSASLRSSLQGRTPREAQRPERFRQRYTYDIL